MKINAAVLIDRLLSNQNRLNLRTINPYTLQGMLAETSEIINNIMLVVSEDGVRVDYHETLNEMLTMRSSLDKLDSEDEFIYGCQNALAIAIKEMMAMQGTTKEADE
jgi:hypothetical protein